MSVDWLPQSFAVGKRGIAGTLVLIAYERELLENKNTYSTPEKKQMQIPQYRPFNLGDLVVWRDKTYRINLIKVEEGNYRYDADRVDCFSHYISNVVHGDLEYLPAQVGDRIAITSPCYIEATIHSVANQPNGSYILAIGTGWLCKDREDFIILKQACVKKYPFSKYGYQPIVHLDSSNSPQGYKPQPKFKADDIVRFVLKAANPIYFNKLFRITSFTWHDWRKKYVYHVSSGCSTSLENFNEKDLILVTSEDLLLGDKFRITDSRSAYKDQVFSVQKFTTTSKGYYAKNSYDYQPNHIEPVPYNTPITCLRPEPKFKKGDFVRRNDGRIIKITILSFDSKENNWKYTTADGCIEGQTCHEKELTSIDDLRKCDMAEIYGLIGQLASLNGKLVRLGELYDTEPDMFFVTFENRPCDRANPTILLGCENLLPRSYQSNQDNYYEKSLC